MCFWILTTNKIDAAAGARAPEPAWPGTYNSLGLNDGMQHLDAGCEDNMPRPAHAGARALPRLARPAGAGPEAALERSVGASQGVVAGGAAVLGAPALALLRLLLRAPGGL